ncbi:pilus assembly protein PilO [Clostridium beijerinckii]|uniref:Pilus assembly protein PilO n=1 Tax=Clostridium beijerinckii TaxID=1520 RepID=A0AAW3WBK3_CLOBE|nr:pilus assembly protein PilO [Clostridium beijerinckii]MBC2455834.1 pilus assembly protein PilO [Clostridium beijerinckii]MBC2475889.1 pilus assembly protein PilO [Clostridium beijerinckii]MDG5852945.1 pilus assembly protein PilO [Clostridium beijerinckii]NOV61784.1 type IV pilus assembly protein PilO [Clostridium beijerinckii]NOV68720.1 type IV pilus assembly protein PilO [Clostridium beijerinckii]
MKISNREKVMLYILGIIVVGLTYYKFVYSYEINIIQQKINKQNEIQQKYATTINIINSIESKKSDIKILKAKISDESLPFYPTISEEHIILELDNLLKSSGLDGGIKFNPIVSNSVETEDKKSNTLAESSLQEVVDQYNSVAEGEEGSSNGNKKTSQNNDVTSNNGSKSGTNTNTQNSTSDDNKSNTNNSSNSNTNNSNSSISKSKEKDQKKNTLQYVKVEVNFKGSYDALNKLLNTIGKNEKKIVVNSIKVDEDTLDSIKGTIYLEIYSVPKIDDELESYLKWDLNNTYGKSVPFSTGAASGKIDTNKDTNDFVATVKSSTSDLPTVMLGKVNDDLKTTYVYTDSNSTENVEMVLTQDGDKYYYKYKTSKETFPKNYDGLGVEFIPASPNIVLNIDSEHRVNSNDKSELKLKIINKTDKLVNVNITGDDQIDPRVMVDGDGSNISVNQK